MIGLVDLIVLAAVTYRVGRFVVLDTLFDGTRDRFHGWLLGRQTLWAEKLSELFSCPYCITVWIAAAVVAFWGWLIVDWPGWAFLPVWLAVATGALVFWFVIDRDETALASNS